MVKHSFTFLNLLFIGAIVYLGVDAFYLITSSRMGTHQPAAIGKSEVTPRTKNRQHPPSYYNPIVERNLFDTKTTAAAAPQAVNVEGLQQTNLKLKLWGTVTGNKEEAYAVIEESGKRQQNLYRVGDSVQNATVKLILREKIVLSINGKDEILEIEKAASRRSKAAIASKAGSGTRRTDTGRRPLRAQKITLRRSQIETALQDVNQLLSQVNVRPHFNQGQPDGLMLSRIRPNSLFMRMGLRNGDIISGVNGRNIESVDDALRFYESLKSSENVTLQLKRGGRQRTIEYSIK